MALVYAVDFNLIISYVIVWLSRLCETVFQFFSSPLPEKEKEEEEEEVKKKNVIGKRKHSQTAPTRTYCKRSMD